MIEVKVQKSFITVSGHAGNGPPGHDIVCAAVSVLTQNLIKSIEDLTEDKIEYEISPGRVDIHYGNLSEKSKTLVDSFFIGVCAVAESCPENVMIKQAGPEPKPREGQKKLGSAPGGAERRKNEEKNL